MYAPRVFVSMICVLVAFAVAAYWITGSVLSVLLPTVICAILLQAGYFVGILYLVRREKMEREGVADPAASVTATGARATDKLPADAARHLK